MAIPQTVVKIQTKQNLETMDLPESKGYKVKIISTGFCSDLEEGKMSANCSCTLLIGPENIIVDTMTAWDKDIILEGLLNHNIAPDQINYVVSTHGHSDHIGNNNLFLKAKHIVGFSISFQDTYYLHDFYSGEEYIINDFVKIIPTPGHTMSDVTVFVKAENNETWAIAGDLFERAEDIDDPTIWEDAGSELKSKQRENRYKVAFLADWIIPGHGPSFRSTGDIRYKLKNQLSEKDASFC